MMAARRDPLDTAGAALALALEAVDDARARYVLRPERPPVDPNGRPIDHGLPTVRGRLPALDAARLALELRAAMVAARAVRRRIMAGTAGPDDALTLAWLAVDVLTLAAVLEPAEGYRAARIAAEAAAESGGRTARAHVVEP